MKEKKIIIIGAGPAGLGAAWRLKELGHKNFIVYEKNPYPGGLCASFTDKKGFTWDIGGHVVFSAYDYFNRLFSAKLQNAFQTHTRQAWIRSRGRWIPFPFQNNLRHLSKKMIDECVDGLKKRKTGKKSKNFREWIVDNFGEGIAKHFMFPYNQKVWAHPLSLLDVHWISERVSRVSLKEILQSIHSQTDKADWGPNAFFRYPLHGGTGGFFKKLAQSLSPQIRYSSAVQTIDTQLKKILISNGLKDSYDTLINTSPLDKLAQILIPNNERLKRYSEHLIHNGVLIVGLGFKQPCPSGKGWIYFPDKSSPFFRVTYLSNYSPFNAPDKDNYYSLLCEIAYSDYKKRGKNKTAVIHETLRGLIRSGLIDDKDKRFIVSRFFLDVPYAYPVPTLGRDAALRRIQPMLEEMDIYSRGRFGTWKYEIGNMDHSLICGKEIIDRLLNKRLESVWSLKK